MLTKEQIRQIENDKKLFFFIVELLKLKSEVREVEMTAVLKNGKMIKRKKLLIEERQEHKICEPIYM